MIEPTLTTEQIKELETLDGSDYEIAVIRAAPALFASAKAYGEAVHEAVNAHRKFLAAVAERGVLEAALAEAQKRIAALEARVKSADNLVDYLAPAFPVMETMMQIGNLRMGSEKARQMLQEIEVFRAARLLNQGGGE